MMLRFPIVMNIYLRTAVGPLALLRDRNGPRPPGAWKASTLLLRMTLLQAPLLPCSKFFIGANYHLVFHLYTLMQINLLTYKSPMNAESPPLLILMAFVVSLFLNHCWSKFGSMMMSCPQSKILRIGCYPIVPIFILIQLHAICMCSFHSVWLSASFMYFGLKISPIVVDVKVNKLSRSWGNYASLKGRLVQLPDNLLLSLGLKFGLKFMGFFSIPTQKQMTKRYIDIVGM